MQNIESKLNIQLQNNEGDFLLADIFYPSDKKIKATIIYAHGFNGFKDWGNFNLIANQFTKAGFCFVKFNFSHNGIGITKTSEFSRLDLYKINTYSKEKNDVAFIIDWLCSENFYNEYELNIEDIYLFGHSRGLASCILNAENKRVQKILSWAGIGACTSPWTNFSEEKLQLWKKEKVYYYQNKRTGQDMPIGIEIYEDYKLHEQEYNLKNRVKNLHKAMCFIHGKNDEAVPYQTALDYQKINPKFAHAHICEGNHVFGRAHPWVKDELPFETLHVIEKSISFFLFH